MKRRYLALAAILLAAGLVAPPPARAQITAAQPELPKEKLTIVGKDGQRHDLMVEMALTPDQQEIGLMFRKSVPPDGGMLFDWGEPRPAAMWMKNTVSSLDMVFINQDGTIRRIAENTVPESLATIDPGGPVRATLEVGAGTARRLNIHAGDHVESRLFPPS